MQDLRQGDQERGMRRLQQAIRKMHLQEEIGESQKASIRAGPVCWIGSLPVNGE